MDFCERANESLQYRNLICDIPRLLIEAQRRFQASDSQFRATQRPVERVAADPVEPLPLADNQAGLRPAKQLVSTECDDIGSQGNAFRNHGFFWQAVLTEIKKRAASQILHNRNLVFPADHDKFTETDAGGEPDDPEVTGVHLEQ